MKEFDYCLCHKARVFAFCPLYPKICRLTIYMQWFCQEFKKQAASRLHAEAHRFLHIIWRCFSKSPSVHWGMLGFHFLALSYSPGCWFCQRHNHVCSLVTSGSVQKLCSGRDQELQLTERAEMFLLTQGSVQHSSAWVFLSAAGLNWQRSTQVHRIRIVSFKSGRKRIQGR